MDTRRYRGKLGRAKYVSMLDLKAGFHNVPFEKTSSYMACFTTHRGIYRWLRMPMGLTQAPAHFQRVVEAALNPEGARKLPIVVYLDDVAVYGDDEAQLLEDTAEAVKRLATFGFMLNLKKSQLAHAAAKVLGHQWTSGGYWSPTTHKLEAIAAMTDEELSRTNRASLFGLLNFFREYVPTFAEQVEPLRELLGQDSKLWTPQATKAVRGLVGQVMGTCRWMNPAMDEELRMEVRLSPGGLAAVVLQRDPQAPRRWLPVSCWGRTLEATERHLPHVVLELMAFREAAWKLADVCAYARPGQLSMAVSAELKALLKLAGKAHPQLQAMLVDLHLYRPRLVAATTKVAPPELHM